MNDAVIVGIISVLGNFMISGLKYRVHEQKQEDTLHEIQHEQTEIKKRLDQHNGYAEKFASTNKDIAVIQRDVEHIKEEMKNLSLCKLK